MFAALTGSASLLVAQPTYDDTVVAWNSLAIKKATSNNARGLLRVRALAIMHVAMYDAWAPYDAAAPPTQGDSIRRRQAERTNNRISHSVISLLRLCDNSHCHRLQPQKCYAAACRMSLSFLTARGISSAEMLLKPSMNPCGDGRSRYEDDSGASQSFWRAARSAIS